MAIQTELEYTSTGVGSLPHQYVSIAVGSPVLEYSHINIGTTPEPEPMSLASSPQEPATTQQTITLEASTPPAPEPLIAPLAETGPSMTEVTFPHRNALFFLTDFAGQATKPLTYGNELHTI